MQVNPEKHECVNYWLKGDVYHILLALYMPLDAFFQHNATEKVINVHPVNPNMTGWSVILEW